MEKGRLSLSPLKRGVAALLSVGIGLLAVAQAAQAEDLETLKSGVLQVTIQPYMPYTAMKDGKARPFNAWPLSLSNRPRASGAFRCNSEHRPSSA